MDRSVGSSDDPIAHGAPISGCLEVVKGCRDPGFVHWVMGWLPAPDGSS